MMGRNVDCKSFTSSRSEGKITVSNQSHSLPLPLTSIRKSKHASAAKANLEKVAGFFSKVDPILGNLCSKAKPEDYVVDTKKRKSVEDESTDASPKKKSNSGGGGGNGILTLSQREQNRMESLAIYLEERGGV